LINIKRGGIVSKNTLIIIVIFFIIISNNIYCEKNVSQINLNDIRVQLLSKSLFRIEMKGKKGFEDRKTFTVVNRDWSGVKFEEVKNRNGKIITTADYKIIIPSNKTLKGIKVFDNNGKLLIELDANIPKNSFLPSPSDLPDVWLMADSPRIVPPEWGATPPPADCKLPNSGWDINNNAPDIYVFLPKKSGYVNFRKEFLKLTGAIPMPPLYAFGYIHSRWYSYTEKSALETIDKYRRKKFPIDVFVCDTDWRVGASDGYAVNKNLFPDMKRFLNEAHDKNIKIFFNDHPEPVDTNALSPKELQFRWDGLTSLMKIGLDAWWYDRNWHTGLNEPISGLRKEIWGMCVYHDITQKFRPDTRPLIMSNVQGIDNGKKNYPSHPAAHRYPIWWTGDTRSIWEYLRSGIANGVNSGIDCLLPYVGEDIGGHWGNPTTELFIRFIQFGVLSPTTRPHCTKNETRDPWSFGREAENIVRDYVQMRYRLLPVIYSAAHEAYETGTPLIRRCDLYWPKFKSAQDNQQYLFGDDILVAPVNESIFTKSIICNSSLFKAKNGTSGFNAEYFNNTKLEGKHILSRIDKIIDFDWKTSKPAKKINANNFSTRWTAQLGPIQKSGNYTFKLIVDDGCRLWLDDKLIIESWQPNNSKIFFATQKLEKGKSYNLKFEYFELGGQAVAKLTVGFNKKNTIPRSLWIPPGFWHNAWSGELIKGPQKITEICSIRKTPLFIRDGAIVFSLPQMQYTNQKIWDKIIVDAYLPRENGKQTRELYEDDGSSVDYQKDKFCITTVSLSKENKKYTLNIAAIKGDYPSAVKKRNWIVRLHIPKGKKLNFLSVNGKALNLTSDYKIIKPNKKSVEIPFKGENSPDGFRGGNIVEFEINKIDTKQNIKIEISCLTNQN